MDYLIAIFAAGLVAAFIISAVDYFVDLGLVRAVIAVVSSLVALLLLGHQHALTVVVAETLAASFVAMFLLQIVAKLNEPTRRR
jgi:hypothetical protein